MNFKNVLRNDSIGGQSIRLYSEVAMPVPLLDKQTDKQAKICDMICFSSLGKKLIYFYFQKILGMLLGVYEICKCHPSGLGKQGKKRVLGSKKNQKISFKKNTLGPA